MRVLVAEDELRLADAIARGLRRQGMAVDLAPDGHQALAKARVVRYDVLVLDRQLPVLHGDDVCRSVREERPETGILMLTAAGDLEDVIEGLALGADDYLAKPFRFAELVARIQALARRALPSRPPVLRHADLELDPASRRLTRDGRELELARKEFGVLEALMARAGRDRLGRAAARARLGRTHRPVHQRRADDDHDVAPQARRSAARRDGDRGRLPDGLTPAAMIALRARTIRFRLTALYGAVFLVCGAALLTVGYMLVRHNIEGHHRFHAALARLGLHPVPGTEFGFPPVPRTRG